MASGAGGVTMEENLRDILENVLEADDVKGWSEHDRGTLIDMVMLTAEGKPCVDLKGERVPFFVMRTYTKIMGRHLKSRCVKTDTEKGVSMTSYDEAHLVAKTMAERGTIFVRCLGEALYVADHDDRQRIKEAFPELWKVNLRKATETEP